MAEYQRQHDIVRRTVALLDRQSRGTMGAAIGSRAATSARYESSEIRRLQGLVARQQEETRALRDRLNSVTQRVASNNSQGLGRASRNQRNNYLAMGGGFAAMSRYGMGSLPFIGGAMGFSAINRSSQEHATAPLTVQAAFEKTC